MAKSYRDYSLEELEPHPMNFCIYAIHILKGRLPDEYHDKMLRFLDADPNNVFVKCYLKSVKKETTWDRLRRFFGYA